MKQRLTFTNRVHLPFRSQPIRHGVPWPRGAVKKETAVAAFAEDGKQIPLAARVINCWPDGSVQWTLLDFALDFGPSGTRTITVVALEGSPAPMNPQGPVKIEQSGERIVADNGLGRLVFETKGSKSLVESWTADGWDVLGADGFDVVLADEKGTRYSAASFAHRKVFVENSNPLRAIVRVEGKHQAKEGETLLDFWMRFTVTAG